MTQDLVSGEKQVFKLSHMEVTHCVELNKLTYKNRVRIPRISKEDITHVTSY